MVVELAPTSMFHFIEISDQFPFLHTSLYCLEFSQRLTLMEQLELIEGIKTKIEEEELEAHLMSWQC